MKYGEILKRLRTEKGLSQKELTDLLTINRSTYARYETSSTQPDFETLSKLADFYDVSVDYLLGRTENKNALHTQAGITDEAYYNLSAYQKEVIDFFLTRENLFFKNQPENILDALEQFEVYYEVWKKQQENKK
ncbi:helix-turn-helix transcriptional regulator [Lysinibacillus capsici]|uniref:helix-turn-helix domain-containing protein n=1 Tax=Lysinibacillus TaxID=400634 RepID=UPI000CA2F18D|nr:MULTISPECIES: helix-turn-helix transcriptional regulator [Lysinibacillus]AUS87767.1 XRE family transcriptional regulator [Lysinibacillus sp. YS11]WPK04251.1 helix-turn-helix transcriptional regulator [Lysinibacillus capsici]